jgi:hypothetical protein
MASPQPPAAGSKEREQTAGANESSAFTPGGTPPASSEPRIAAPAREPPFTLSGRYVVERQLGAGGMGRVYLARDLKMKRAVAVKLLSAQAATAEQLRRLEEEALVVGSLGHPNVVAVHDIGHDGDQPFIVQEFLEGSTLRDLARRQPPSIDEAIRIATQIARGLGAAHEKEIVHCDLKPENVFVSTDGWVKILDFGVARLSAGSRANAADSDDPSGGGWFSGTLRYSSPEQIRGSVLDVRSDIFSFGVVLHELLTGRHPFAGSNSIQVGWSIVNRAPAELPPEVPHPIRAVVKRSLQKDRRNRFQTGKDLAFALEAISSGARPPVWTRRRTLLMLAAAVPGAGAAAWWVLSRPPPIAQRFQQLTFFPGAVWTARFHKDANTVAYTEAWDGHPPRIYTTKVSDQGYQHPEIANSVLLAVSGSGDLAVLRSPRFEGFDYAGTLAVVPSSGGTPREVATDAHAADWADDGALAAVLSSHARQQLEFPIGRVVYETAGWLDGVRVAPRRGLLAAIDHPTQATDVGNLVVVDGKGERRTLASGFGKMHGLAWDPSGDEIWFTGSAPSESALGIHIATLDGRIRSMMQAPGDWHLQDRSPAGDLLMTQPHRYIGVVGGRGDSQTDLSMRDEHILNDLSRDGSLVLLTVKDAQGPDGEGGIYVRAMDGSAPIRIASGYGGAFAPDAKTAMLFSIASNKLSIIPTGPGKSHDLDPLPFNVTWVRFFPDGTKVLLEGESKGSAARLFVLPLPSGSPVAISPEGIEARWTAISPGGDRVAAVIESSAPVILPAGGGPAQAVPGARPGEKPYGWVDDSTLIVGTPLQAPLPLDAIDVRSGARRAWRSVRATVAGVNSIRRVLFAANPDVFAYEHLSRKTHLYFLGMKHR